MELRGPAASAPAPTPALGYPRLLQHSVRGATAGRSSGGCRARLPPGPVAAVLAVGLPCGVNQVPCLLLSTQISQDFFFFFKENGLLASPTF